MPLNRRIKRVLRGEGGQGLLPLKGSNCFLVLGNQRSGTTRVLRLSIEEWANEAQLKVIVVTKHRSHWDGLSGVCLSTFVDQGDSEPTYRAAFQEAVCLAGATSGIRIVFILDNADTLRHCLKWYMNTVIRPDMTLIVLRNKLQQSWDDPTVLPSFDHVALFKLYGEETRQCIRRGLPRTNETVLYGAAHAHDGQYFML